MQPDLPEHSTLISPALKPPRPVLNGIFAFPPNRDTLGGTAYFIVENSGNILIDCPAWNEANQIFLQQQGGIRWLVLTHRGGIGKVREISQAFGCDILIQEQEAYLLPGLSINRDSSQPQPSPSLTSFQLKFTISPHSNVIWTPGHSPGSSCLYYSGSGGVLFTGRHLLPNPNGTLVPLRTSKTFHWPRQLKSVQLLRELFTPTTLNYICPGANTGFLRGKGVIEQAYQHLYRLDVGVSS